MSTKEMPKPANETLTTLSLPSLSVCDIKALMKMDTKLEDYGKGDLTDTLSGKFTDMEQQMFVKHFLLSSNYEPTNFCIDFDDAWKYAGFTRKDNAKTLLDNKKKGFKINIDYIIKLAPATAGTLGGIPGEKKREDILLTTDGFKKLCIKASTDRANEIHDYYLNLEKAVLSIFKEDYERKLAESEKRYQDELKRHGIMIEDNFNGEEALYMGHTEPKVAKFGISIQTDIRKDTHMRTIPGFRIEYIVRSRYARRIETEIKTGEFLKSRRIVRTYGGKVQTELIQFDDDFTMLDLYNYAISLRDKFEKAEIESKENARLKLELAEARSAIEQMKVSTLTNVVKEHEVVIKEQAAAIKKKDIENTTLIGGIIVRDIDTGEEKTAKNSSTATKLCVFTGTVLGFHSDAPGDYLNLYRQNRGYTFRNVAYPYWIPPINFKYDRGMKASRASKFLKITDPNGVISYHNSITEAGNYYADSIENREQCVYNIKRIKNKQEVEPTNALFGYTIVEMERCGFLVYSDGSRINIDQEAVIQFKAPVEALPVIVTPEMKIPTKMIIEKPKRVRTGKPISVIAMNILTREDTSFANVTLLKNTLGIENPTRYTDKPQHTKGYAIRSTDAIRYWQPPVNFKFTSMSKIKEDTSYLKATNDTTEEVAYYANITDAAAHILGYTEDIHDMNLKYKLIANIAHGRTTETSNTILKNYTFKILESCGSWVYKDGTIEEIEK